jgi:hypothetical protein
VDVRVDHRMMGNDWVPSRPVTPGADATGLALRGPEVHKDTNTQILGDTNTRR